MIQWDTNDYVWYVLETIKNHLLPLAWDERERKQFVEEHESQAVLQKTITHYSVETFLTCAEIHSQNWAKYLLTEECGELEWVKFEIKDGDFYIKDGEKINMHIIAIPIVEEKINIL
jgi:hypothetical protein